MIIVASTLAVSLPLLLWRWTFDSTDWAALFLLPLAVVLFLGVRKVLLATIGARATLELRGDSPISLAKAVGIRATTFSTLFAICMLPVLALEGAVARRPVLLAMIGLCAASSAIALKAPGRFERHFNQPFATMYGLTFGAALCAVAFTPVLLYLNVASGECEVLTGVWSLVISQEGRVFESLVELIKVIECVQLEAIGWLTWGQAVVRTLYGLLVSLVAFAFAEASAFATVVVQDLLKGDSVGFGN